MKVVHGFFAALLIFGWGIVSAAQANDSAQKFLESIYQKYNGKDAPGAPVSGDNALEFFTPEVAALIAADAARAEKNDEPPALDGDPFVGAQDWDIKDVTVAVKDAGPGRAIGLVSFVNLGEKKIVELDLKMTKQGWRIDEIRWAEGTLRDTLAGEGSGKDEEKELPGTQKL